MSQRWKTFENNVAKELGKWMFGDPKALRRTPCSGGWKGRGTGGDITIPDDRPELREFDMFAYEAKNRVEKKLGKTGWHFEQLLTSPKHSILEWWYTLTNSKPVQVEKKLRFMVFSKTCGIAKAYVALGEAEVEFLEEAGISLRALPKIVFEVGRCEDPSVETEILHFFCFREFLAYVDPKPLKELWRRKYAAG
jgi:hypothetical protein